MNFINILFIFIWGLVVPFILGYQFDLVISKEKISYGRCLIFGYVLYCASFQIVAPIFIIKGGSFLNLYHVWLVLVVVIVAIVLILNRKAIVARITEPFKAIGVGVKSNNGSILKYILSKYDWLDIIVFVGALFFVIFHTLLIGYMMHFDTDDARFVAEALEAYEKDTLLSYHPITGDFIGTPIGEMLKDVYAPYPIFMAVYGKLFGLSPAIATHTVLPFLYVPMCYMAFYLIAKQIFNNEKKSIGIAVLLFGAINTFSMETIFSFGWVLLTLVWQGRSFLCTVMIPLMLYILMQFIIEKEIERYWYIILSITGVACCMLSGMGSMLMLLMIASFAFVALLVKKDIKNTIYMLLALAPTALYFVLYSAYSGRI